MDIDQSSAKTLIFRRFLLLSGLGTLGAVSFVPSISASAAPPPSTVGLFLFVVVVSTVCCVSSWFGLRLADAAHLPMPYLRRLDASAERPGENGLLAAIGFGIVFAAASIFVLRSFHVANLAGPLWTRMATVFFAAGSLEIVVHLLIMSAVVRITRGRVWAGILVAALFFVGFHVAGLGGHSAALIAASVLLNGTFGLVLGFLCARYGFEYVVVCHGIAHVLAVSLA